MAGAALLAVVASLLTASTVAPALGLLLSRRQPLRRESPVTRGIKSVYAAVFAPVVRTPIPAFVAMGVLVIGAAFVVPTFKKSLLPTLHDTNLLVKWDGPHGTSLPEMDRITSRAATELRALPGVRDVGAQVGQASLGDAPVGSDSAEMWVSIDPSADYGKTVKAVKDVVAGYPGFHHEVTTYTKNRMTDVLAPTQDQITVRVFGNDSLETLEKTAADVQKAVAGTDGVVERAHRLAADRADDGGRGRSGEGQGSRDQARRRPSRRRDHAVGPPGRQPLRGPEGLRRGRVEHAGHPLEPVRRRGPAHRHARRRPRPPG